MQEYCEQLKQDLAEANAAEQTAEPKKEEA